MTWWIGSACTLGNRCSRGVLMIVWLVSCFSQVSAKLRKEMVRKPKTRAPAHIRAGALVFGYFASKHHTSFTSYSFAVKAATLLLFQKSSRPGYHFALVCLQLFPTSRFPMLFATPMPFAMPVPFVLAMIIPMPFPLRDRNGPRWR